MNSIAKKLTIIIGSRVTGALAGLRNVGSRLDALASKTMRWGAIAATAGLTAGFAIAGNSVVKLGARMENTRLVYQTMLGSVERGNAMLAKLDDFSNSTPFSGDQVNRAAKTLLGYGVTANNLIPILRTVGDAASGSDKDFNELSAVFGKVFAKGKMDTEALNQMIEAGIPILGELQKQYNKSGEEIYKMASKGEISASAVTKAFAAMTGEGGVFENMMAKQSETLTGMWGAFTGQLEYAASILGESLTPLFKKLMGVAVDLADKLVEMAKDGRLLQYLATIGMTGVNVCATLIKWFNRIYEYGAAVFKTLQRVTSLVFESLQASITGAFAYIVSNLIKGLNAVIEAYNSIAPSAMQLSIIGEPEFVDQVRQWAKMSAENAKNEFKAISSGQDFKDASANIDRKNAGVDRMADKLTFMIAGGLESALDELAKKQRDAANTDFGAPTPPEDKAAKSAKYKTDKIDTDRLTKIGLYNFGQNAIKSLDTERNRLLKTIANNTAPRGFTTVEVMT